MNNYFSHDSNARNSDKLIPLRMRLGAEGYGIYFMILERLREEPGYTSVKDYNMIAFDLRVDTGKVKSVIEDFGLFVFTEDGKYFYSESFKRRMQQKDDKSRKLSEAGKKGNERRWKNNTDNQQENRHPITTQSPPDRICDENLSQEKKRKEKESKGKNIPPLSPNGDIPQGELEFPLDENFESPVKPQGEKEKSSAKKEKEPNYSFDEFWNLYDKKTGEKKKLAKKWLALTDEEREAIMNYIPKYIECQPEKQFRKNPETFLNNKSWNDELIPRNNGNRQLPSTNQWDAGRNNNPPGRTNANDKKAERDRLGEMARAILRGTTPKND